MNADRPQDDARRVVVSGVGMVTPLGVGKEEFGRRLFAGDTAIRGIQSFDTGDFSSHLGAEVTEFKPRDFIAVKNLRRMDKISLMTVASARMALEDAGLQITAKNRDRVGIILGTAFGATDITVQFLHTLLQEGPASVNPILVPNTVMNAPAGHTSIELGFRGINTTITHFAVSAENAMAYAAAEIRRGAADFIFAGGSDILSEIAYRSLIGFGALSPQDKGNEICRPFDQERNGCIAGEGCGMILLESLQSAKQRGCNYYCEISGAGMGASPTRPNEWPRDTEGIKRTFARAVKNAGITINDLQAIYAGANGDKILDAVEAEAYAEIFDAGKCPFITSIKGATGESFSSGGIRACAAALSMANQILPPTAGLAKPLRALDFVIQEKKEADIHHAALAGISFGGTYCYLIFSKS
jgi:3-oxoacyl-[acyl-carrier-protein] synthase II